MSDVSNKSINILLPCSPEKVDKRNNPKKRTARIVGLLGPYYGRLKQLFNRQELPQQAEDAAMNSLTAPPIAVHRRKANVSIAAGLAFLLLWSAVAPINGAVIARGAINADQHRKSISHFEGGIVKTIEVHEGEQVIKGQTLITVDTTLARAQVDAIVGKLAPANYIRDRLIAEQLNTSRIDWSALDGYTLSAVQDQRLKSQQQLLFDSRYKKLSNTLAIYRQSLKQMAQQRAALNLQLDMHRQQIALFDDEISDLKILYSQGLVSKIRLRELQREMLAKHAAQSAVQSQQSQLQERSAETLLKMRITKRDWQATVVSELQLIEENIVQLRQQLLTTSQSLARTDVFAPDDGVIIDLRVHTIGGTVQRGEVLLDMVPINSPLVVHARVKPEDIEEIYPGQTTQVRFSSFSQRNTVPSDALVRSVSADLITDSETGEKYYLAQIDLSEQRESAHELVVGMPVEVMILTQQRSLYDYLTQPLADSFKRAMRET